MDGYTMAQFYSRHKRFLNDLLGMKEESLMLRTLLDFIGEKGALDGLFSDNAKVTAVYAVQDIIRQ